MNEFGEDDLIDGSMPLYFDHIFGTSVGFSQQILDRLPPARTLPKSHPFPSPSPPPPPPHSTRHSQQPAPAILESQGFCPKGVGTGEEASTAREKSFEGSVSPISIEDTPLHSPPANSQHSITLFSSPENEGTSSLTCRKLDHDSQKIVISINTVNGKLESSETKATQRKKQNRKRKHSQVECEYRCPSSCCALRDCAAAERIVNVIAVVVQVNIAMEVACRRGAMTGQTVPMSSLLLSDPTKSYFKLSLWRQAAAWAERLSVGDIVFFKSIRLKLWRGEVVGTTIMQSSVLNLHQPAKKLPTRVLQFITVESVEDLMKWGKEHLGYLFDRQAIPQSQKRVLFRTSHELMGDSVVHFQAKLLCLITSRMALFADHKGIDVHFHLLGKAASQWHNQLSSGVGQVWEMMYVAVVCEGTQTQNSVCNLQTTSRTHLRMLDETCDVACEILKEVGYGEASSEHRIVCSPSIAHVISNKRSGTFKISTKALSMEFILPDASKLSVGEILGLSQPEMVSKLIQAVYVGCESCTQPLPQDANGIYCQCMLCILKLPGGYPSSAYFFQPMNIVLAGNGPAVYASHLTVPKVLGFSGKDIVQANLSGNETKIDISRLEQLFISADWIIKCLVAKDENSFIEELAFSILNVQLGSEHALCDTSLISMATVP